MPVDYQSYLLASSPPGFELDFVVNDHFARRPGYKRSTRAEFSIKPTFSASHVVDADVKADRPPANFRQPESKRSGKLEPKDEEIFNLDDDDYGDYKVSERAASEVFSIKFAERIQAWIESYQCHCDDCNTLWEIELDASSRMGRKKVSFADDFGKELVNIREMTEASDEPPLLRSEILEKLDQCTSTDSNLPSLKLNFVQPASDYLTFRAKLESNFVSLENVLVKQTRLRGTVKVKNVSFEKTVFIRYTVDNWRTSSDVLAEYIRRTNNDITVPFDTFSFEISYPVSDCKKDGKLQFAICYTTPGNQQYWDSNNGQNYTVDAVAKNTAFVDVLSHRQPNVEYPSFDVCLDNGCPYW